MALAPQAAEFAADWQYDKWYREGTVPSIWLPEFLSDSMSADLAETVVITNLSGTEYEHVPKGDWQAIIEEAVVNFSANRGDSFEESANSLSEAFETALSSRGYEYYGLSYDMPSAYRHAPNYIPMEWSGTVGDYDAAYASYLERREAELSRLTGQAQYVSTQYELGDLWTNAVVGTYTNTRTDENGNPVLD